MAWRENRRVAFFCGLLESARYEKAEVNGIAVPRSANHNNSVVRMVQDAQEINRIFYRLNPLIYAKVACMGGVNA